MIPNTQNLISLFKNTEYTAMNQTFHIAAKVQERNPDGWTVTCYDRKTANRAMEAVRSIGWTADDLRCDRTTGWRASFTVSV
jgi:hypothetical protein